MFSQALNAEYAKFNIHVQCQVALFVTTKLAKIRKASLFVPSPEDYARAAVKAIGYDSLVIPYWTHALQLWAMSMLPESFVTKYTLSMHADIRKKGLKKEAETVGKKAN
jgi:17beta-estradiol 17-dehydrogenase / very-long-chain 3-oxoacyl-CoA reductase